MYIHIYIYIRKRTTHRAEEVDAQREGNIYFISDRIVTIQSPCENRLVRNHNNHNKYALTIRFWFSFTTLTYCFFLSVDTIVIIVIVAVVVQFWLFAYDFLPVMHNCMQTYHKQSAPQFGGAHINQTRINSEQCNNVLQDTNLRWIMHFHLENEKQQNQKHYRMHKIKEYSYYLQKTHKLNV